MRFKAFYTESNTKMCCGNTSMTKTVINSRYYSTTLLVAQKFHQAEKSKM